MKIPEPGSSIRLMERHFHVLRVHNGIENGHGKEIIETIEVELAEHGHIKKTAVIVIFPDGKALLRGTYDVTDEVAKMN